MEVTPLGLVRVAAAILAVVVLYGALVVLLRTRAYRRPMSETLLGASLLLVLILNAEVYALSALPVHRPLKWLPLFHGLITAGLVGVLPRAWWTTLRALAESFRQCLRQAGYVLGSALVGLAILLLVYLLFGAYNVPHAWDELEYHVAMAVQPYQDGRVAPVTSDLPWATAYPRGVELLWYWTLEWTGTDLLFHPVQLAFGVQLLLAAYVLARRTRASVRAATLVFPVLATMPVFLCLSTCGYIDLAVASSVIALVALLAPPRQSNATGTRDWPLAALAMAQACLVKLPILAVAFGGIALLHALFFRGAIRSRLREALAFLGSLRGVVAILVILAASHTYWRNWAHHGNPLYPIRVTLADHVVLPGPVDPGLFGGGGHSTAAKPVAKMTRAERFYYAWTDFHQPLNVDSFGSLGRIWPFVILPLFALSVLWALWHRDGWLLALTAMFGLSFFTPAYLPRYGLAMIAVALAGALSVLSRFPRPVEFVGVMIVVAFCLPGLRFNERHVRHSLRWIRMGGGGTLALPTRNAYVYERDVVGYPGYCSPHMTRFIRDHSRPGDLLVWNVRTFHGLLWNRTYSNRVVHLPAGPHDMYPHSAADMRPGATKTWLDRVAELQPRHVLVYTDSESARRLLAEPEWGYREAFRDADRDRYPMILFERVTP